MTHTETFSGVPEALAWALDDRIEDLGYRYNVDKKGVGYYAHPDKEAGWPDVAFLRSAGTNGWTITIHHRRAT